MNFAKKNIGYILFAMAFVLSPTFAMAAGVDTGSSSLTSMQTWLDTWIPLAATLAVIGAGLALAAHLINWGVAWKLGAGMIIIGSASYIVSLFGLGS